MAMGEQTNPETLAPTSRRRSSAATEHLLEHIVARKRDVIELLERALR